MNRRFVVIDNWVTGRYFKKSDIEDFFRSLIYLKKRGAKINPSIRISAPNNQRKTPDIFLCTGANKSTAKERLDGGKILVSYQWNEENEPTYELVGSTDIKGFLSQKGGAEKLTEIVCNHILQTTDSDVELRNIRG